jgi:UDP-3-O-[3-hydroxymyristoyl] glucosamine N-acyltransferase
MDHVKIGPNVRIGAGCKIKSGTVIGEPGFGIEKDEEGDNFRIPHIGGVRIGDSVEIGSLNTICSGTLEPTRVGDLVKTDDHVHIAHNVQIGRNCIITACAEMSGRVVLENDVWLGPNCSIKEGVRIGAGALIGIATLVVKDCEPTGVYAGAPARRLR